MIPRSHARGLVPSGVCPPNIAVSSVLPYCHSRFRSRRTCSRLGLAVHASARSFPRSPLCPLTHLRLVGADLRRMAYTAALNQDAFGTLVHPRSCCCCGVCFNVIDCLIVRVCCRCKRVVR